MMAPITPRKLSIQLYTLRKLIGADGLDTVLGRLAEIGFRAVEPYALEDFDIPELREALGKHGLAPSSAHGPLPDKNNVNELVDTAKALGYSRHIVSLPADHFETREETLQAADTLTQAASLLSGSGITLGYHNHWWEFDHRFDEQTPHALLMEHAEELFAEIDTYWVAIGGHNPAQVVAALGDRVPLLHVKDGPGGIDAQDKPHVALGEGVMDWKDIFSQVPEATSWYVIELDSCETDLYEALGKSFRYLTENGFAVADPADAAARE